MKRILGINTHFYILTALALVILSSCRDQDFDWDAARANGSLDEFTNLFKKEFGTPQDGHQWGFDLADAAMGGAAEEESLTRAAYKQDMQIGNVNTYVLYTPPSDITEKEQQEVYAWFSNHKVEWVSTPSTFHKDNVNAASTRQITNHIATVLTGHENYYENLSLRNYDTNPLGDYDTDVLIGINNAWIQNVACNTSTQAVTYANGNTGEISNTGQYLNHLQAWGKLKDGSYGWMGHDYDFNAGSGYGCNNNTPTVGTVGVNGYQNALLMTDADFTKWAYHCSFDSHYHDKYYFVYLEGDGYKGWYVGFDFEATLSGGSDTQQIKGDGICNDWIIKIVDVGNSTYQKSRIMCEDLGGSMSSGTDIDYNDIVFDVDYDDRNNGASVVTIKLQAAGGTLPIALFYEDERLFEAHEFFYDKTSKGEKTLYQTMINTYQGSKSVLGEEALYNTYEERIDPKTYTLYFNTDEGSNGNTSKKFTGQRFSIGNLKVKVYRLGVEDYIQNGGTSFNEAEWINLDNEDGEAPLKICVPQTDSNGNPSRWMQERVMITDGYTNFRDWVNNSLYKFWERSQYEVNTDCLYGDDSSSSSSNSSASDYVSVTGIALSPNNVVLDVNGGTATLTASILPATATNKTIEWSSANSSIATVDQNGLVTAVAEGTTTITAMTTGGKTATCTVKVSKLVTGISLNPTTKTIKVGRSFTIAATITPNDAIQTLSWSSSNQSIATVDSDGKVTGVNIGTATITATATDGSGRTATCVVTVTDGTGDVQVESITLNPTTKTVVTGAEFSISASVAPDDATDTTITWSSNNTNVATVDSDGKVIAIAQGTATITATANDDSGVYATCLVTVNNTIWNTNYNIGSVTSSQYYSYNNYAGYKFITNLTQTGLKENAIIKIYFTVQNSNAGWQFEVCPEGQTGTQYGTWGRLYGSWGSVTNEGNGTYSVSYTINSYNITDNYIYIYGTNVTITKIVKQ